MNTIRVGIVGVSGYGGGEAARLLAGHPHVELTYVTSGTYAGRPLEAALPGLRGTGLTCQEYDSAAAIGQCDVLVLAGEAGLAMRLAPALLEADKRIVDLSADFRLRSADEYAHWYGKTHTAPHLLAEAAYGLPELNRAEIRAARLVANPGCYPTAAALALAPLLAAGRVDPTTLIVDSLSGVSGAGRAGFSLDYHFAEVNESARAYGVGGTHRHTPEMEQTLAGVAGRPVTLTFTPHLIPITRGILSTAYATLTGTGGDGLHDLYQDYYKTAPFVAVLDDGQMPATKHTQGTNNCHIGLAVDARTGRVVAISVIDNLVKGAAGQAVQNLNLMCGFGETAGLTAGAVWP